MSEAVKEDSPRFFADTNWLDQFLVADGRTTREEFGRGWLLTALLQLALVVVGIALLFARQSVPGMAILLAGLVLGSWAIGILHIRRAHDAGKSGRRAFFVFIPMALALLVAIAPAKQPGQGDTPKASPAVAVKTDGDTAAKPDEPAKAEVTQAESKKPDAKAAKGKHGRKGKPGKPPNPALQKGIGMTGIFAVLAFIMSIVSLMTFWRWYQQPQPNRWGDPGPTLAR